MKLPPLSHNVQRPPLRQKLFHLNPSNPQCLYRCPCMQNTKIHCTHICMYPLQGTHPYHSCFLRISTPPPFRDPGALPPTIFRMGSLQGTDPGFADGSVIPKGVKQTNGRMRSDHHPPPLSWCVYRFTVTDEYYNMEGFPPSFWKGRWGLSNLK